MTAAEPENSKTGRTRNGNGRFDKDPRAAELSARALELRARSRTYRQIAAELDISLSYAHSAVQRGLRETMEEAAEDVRRLELEKLDALERAALDVLGRDHVIVSQGRITDIPDDGVSLQAVTVLLKVAERRAKLLGLDQPAKLTLDGGVRYEVVGVDMAALS